MVSSRTPRRIVLADDEEALAWSLASRLQKALPSMRVEAAHSGEAALELVRKSRLDLLIADIRMPGMSGIDLVIASRRIYPQLPVILMTAFQPTDMTRLESGPFTGFLEKPFEFDLLRDLVDESLLPAAPTTGFSGAISVQTLPDVVQLYVLSSATGMLSIRHESGEGRLYFARGTILHALTERAEGEEAFYEIMKWSAGEFSMHAGTTAPERSVTANWQELLMESVRRIDEVERDGASRPTRPGWTETPPSFDTAFDTAFSDFPDAASLAPSRIPDEAALVQTTRREIDMNIKDSLAKLNQIDGFVGAALVDSESGMLLGQEGGGGLNLEVAAAGNTEVVRAKRKTMNNLALKDGIEDILITLGRQYHLIRPMRARTTIFFYLALDRQRSNLAMARIALADVEKELQV